MDKPKCDEWAKERMVSNPKNPLTNRKIKKNGPKYKELDKDCNDFVVDINSICVKWLKDNHYDLYRQLDGRNKPLEPPQPKKKVPEKAKVVIVPPPPQMKPQINLITEDEDGNEFEDIEPPQNFYYTIEDRIRFGETIKDYFSEVIITDGKACMSQKKTLLKYVDKPKLLGYGSFGNVYGVVTRSDPAIPVAIKEGRILKSEYTQAMKKKYPLEYLYNKLINDLINEKICPNFSFTYAIFFCDKCKLNEFDAKPIITQCSETVVELFDFTMDKLNDLSDEVILSILFQLFYALACIQLEYGMAHNDIKKENILIKVIPAGGYWEYNLNGQTYHVPNTGYIAALNDFGVSDSYRPGISDKNYGRRQAEVVYNSNTGKYLFRPFTTKFFPSINKAGVTKTKSTPLGGDKKLTWNRFFKNFDSEPSIPVDLNDIGRFPELMSHYDILDIFYMVLGGKRATQPGNHAAMKVGQNVHKLLKDFNISMVKVNQAWPEERVDFFLANHTIKTLFSFYTNIRLLGPKIETYSLITNIT